MAPTLRERFDRSRPIGDPDACWIWQGSLTSKGYGQISDRARSIRAHRLAWELEHGEIPEGMQVCHRCDTPSCCNPAHLFLGTNAENQHDKRSKGRSARGTANGGGGKLTEADVTTIRAALAEGESLTTIANRHGVTRQLIAGIRDGKKWSHTT